MLTNEQKPLRVCNVSYLNSSAYRSFTEFAWFDYKETTPEACANKLLDSSVELALVPVAESIAHGGYQLFDYGIVANGPVRSVLVFCENPLESLDTIFLDSSSRTSVILLKILMHYLTAGERKQLDFIAVPAREALRQVGGSKGALVIGDLAFQHRREFRYQIDLAQWWKQATGLPFVFAAWAARPGIQKHECFANLGKAFERSVRLCHVYARAWADERHFDCDAAEDYVTRLIRYHIDLDAEHGLRMFAEIAASLNLLPQTEISFSKLAGEQEGIPLTSSEGEQKADLGPFTKAVGESAPLLLELSSSGKRLSISQAVKLAQEASIADLGLAAYKRRSILDPNRGVYYSTERIVQLTNVCTISCRFCASHTVPGTNTAFVLSGEEISAQVEQALSDGTRNIVVAAGVHPELTLEYFESLYCWIKSRYDVEIHALSTNEVIYLSKISGLGIESVLKRLKTAGLSSIPAYEGEFLVERVRRSLSHARANVEQWCEVHRLAHHLGLSSACSMLFGVGETWEERFIHLHRLRNLQDETGGFTHFILIPSFNTARTGDPRESTLNEYLQTLSLASLFLDNIDRIQSSWKFYGPSMAQISLFFGSNDFGSVRTHESPCSTAFDHYEADGETVRSYILESGFVPHIC